MKLKKRLFIVKSLTLALVLMLAVMLAAPAMAATPQQIEDAIDDGLAYLANVQNANGSWGTGYTVARTGLAVLKFETHAIFSGKSPFDPAYQYSDNVIAGLNYIFANSARLGIGGQPAGNPDTLPNGFGVYFYSPAVGSGHSNYETGVALMAICAGNDPSRIVAAGSETGRTYEAVAQDTVDYLAFGQIDVGSNDRGGWAYVPNQSTLGDNSNSGYVALGLSYAEAPSPWGFGLTVPPFVLSEMNLFWINNVQDAVDGDTNDGGSWYRPLNWAWVNILKTGNLLSQMAMVGDTAVTPRVQDAIDYIERHWSDPNWDPGWRNDYQTCFTTMKGFQALGIDTIVAYNGTDYVSTNWYDEMADMIVATQNPAGYWPNDRYGDAQMTTAWAMLTLEKAAPPALLLLPPFDINEPGESHKVTAVYKIGGVPQEDVEIEFEIISGPNDDEPIASDNTNASGEAEFTYIGDGGEGTDIIKATAVDQAGTPLVSSQATKIWERTTPPVEVGGEVYPVNKLAILAPWLALFALLIPAIIVMRRRRARS